MRNCGEDACDDMDYDIEKMATHAIDRSCGLLLEFTFYGFSPGELLRSIGER